MTNTASIALSSLGASILAAAGVAWLDFADVIYFDTLAAGLAGCFTF